MSSLSKNVFSAKVDLLNNINSTVVAGHDGYLYVTNEANRTGVVYIDDANSNRIGAIGGLANGHWVVPIKAGMKMTLYDYALVTRADFRN